MLVMFSTLPNTNFNFWVRIILLSANTSNSDKSKILLFSEELNKNYWPAKSLVIIHESYLKRDNKTNYR